MIPIDFGERVIDPEPDFGCADLARKWTPHLKEGVRIDIISIQTKDEWKGVRLPLGVRIRGKRRQVPKQWWPRVREVRKWILEHEEG